MIPLPTSLQPITPSRQTALMTRGFGQMAGSIPVWETPSRVNASMERFKSLLWPMSWEPHWTPESIFINFFGKEMAQIHAPSQISVNPWSNLCLNIRSLTVRPLSKCPWNFYTTCFGKLGSGAKDLRWKSIQKDSKKIKIMILIVLIVISKAKMPMLTILW